MKFKKGLYSEEETLCHVLRSVMFSEHMNIDILTKVLPISREMASQIMAICILNVDKR